jgi:deoxyribodipyrimidine photolyase
MNTIEQNTQPIICTTCTHYHTLHDPTSHTLATSIKHACNFHHTAVLSITHTYTQHHTHTHTHTCTHHHTHTTFTALLHPESHPPAPRITSHNTHLDPPAITRISTHRHTQVHPPIITHHTATRTCTHQSSHAHVMHLSTPHTYIMHNIHLHHAPHIPQA